MAPHTTPQIEDYYTLLSIPPGATDAEIRRAYRKTSLLYHPDKVTPTPETTRKFELLQTAYAVLSDTAEKQKYDTTRDARLRRQAEHDALDDRRRKMKEDLESRERDAALRRKGFEIPQGTKRDWTEAELEQRQTGLAQMRAANKTKVEEYRQKILRRRMGERQEEEANVPVPPSQNHGREDTSRPTTTSNTATHDPDPEPNAAEDPEDTLRRSVKVHWLRHPESPIDADWLRTTASRTGPVEHVRVLGDRKKKIEGPSRKKSVVGTALIVFRDLDAAKEAVRTGMDALLDSVGEVAVPKTGG